MTNLNPLIFICFLNVLSILCAKSNNDPFLVGTWKNDAQNITIILTKGEFTFLLPNNTLLGTYTTDTSKTPFWIDFVVLNAEFLAPKIPGIYQHGLLLNDNDDNNNNGGGDGDQGSEDQDLRNRFTLQIPSKSDIYLGHQTRPTEFTEEALVFVETSSKPQVQSDPWLIDTWYDNVGIVSMHFSRKEFTASFNRSYSIAGDYDVDINKSPMWINLHVIEDGKEVSYIPGIYQQGSTSSDDKQLTIQIASQAEIESGSPKRPTQFTSSAMVLTDQKPSNLGACPEGSMTCSECETSCDHICEVAGKRAKKCGADCETAFCAFCD